MYLAPKKSEAIKAYKTFLGMYEAKFPKTCECLKKDFDALFTLEHLCIKTHVFWHLYQQIFRPYVFIYSQNLILNPLKNPIFFQAEQVAQEI